MFRSQWRIYGNVQADVIISQAKKREKKSHSFTQEPKKSVYGLLRNPKMNCDVQQATQKGTPVKR